MSETRQNNAGDASARERAAILRRLAPPYTGNAMRRRTLEAQLPDIVPVMLRHHLRELIREGHVTNYGGWLRNAAERECDRPRTLICNPKVGNVVRPKHSRTGRCWRVTLVDFNRDICVLVPIGDDVVTARSERIGRWQGGVRTLRKPWRDIVGWELVRE